MGTIEISGKSYETDEEGYLTDLSQWNEELAGEISVRPPVMLVHGAADEVIPVAALHLTREALAAAGIGVDWHVREGLGHGIDGDVVGLTAQFLARHLR